MIRKLHVFQKEKCLIDINTASCLKCIVDFRCIKLHSYLCSQAVSANDNTLCFLFLNNKELRLKFSPYHNAIEFGGLFSKFKCKIINKILTYKKRHFAYKL